MINWSFIISAPRSGSTLLRVYLNKSKNIISPPETYFLDFYKRNKQISLQTKESRKDIVTRWTCFRSQLNQRRILDKNSLIKEFTEFGTSWQNLLELTFLNYAKQSGKNTTGNLLFIEKTPLNIYFIDELIELFPHSKVIHLIRDPRDVVASLKTCPWFSSNIIYASKTWLHSVKLEFKNTSTLKLKYEEMLLKPESIYPQIESFLGIELTTVDTNITSDLKENKDSKNFDSFKSPDAKHINKWLEKLSRDDLELEIIESICEKEMNKLGYETKSQTTKIFKLIVMTKLRIDRFTTKFLRKLL